MDDPPGLNLKGDVPVRSAFGPLFQQCYALVAANSVPLSLPSTPVSLNDCATSTTFKFVLIGARLMDDVVSNTRMKHGKPKCTIYYSNKDFLECPPIIHARFLHEATHAIRRLHAKALGIACLTPPRSPEHDESRYKLTESAFHSGYLLEHLHFGGIIVLLKGNSLSVDGQDIQLPVYAKVVKRESVPQQDSYRLKCSLWDLETQQWGPIKEYSFDGDAVTRNIDGCGR